MGNIYSVFVFGQNWLVTCIHHMGGSIRKDFDCSKITHLIANKVGGEKYHYAVTFKIPVMCASWVRSAWEQRHELGIRATDYTLVMEKEGYLYQITFS